MGARKNRDLVLFFSFFFQKLISFFLHLPPSWHRHQLFFDEKDAPVLAMRETALETSIDLLYINHLEWNFIHVRIDINSQANELPRREVDVSPSSSLESRLVHRRKRKRALLIRRLYDGSDSQVLCSPDWGDFLSRRGVAIPPRRVPRDECVKQTHIETLVRVFITGAWLDTRCRRDVTSMRRGEPGWQAIVQVRTKSEPKL